MSWVVQIGEMSLSQRSRQDALVKRGNGFFLKEPVKISRAEAKTDQAYWVVSEHGRELREGIKCG